MSTASKQSDDGVRIVISKSCPSITGKSTLTYHLGMAGADPQIRLHGNSGRGFFNREWVSVSRVIEALPKVGPFTSYVLRSVLKGRSLNSRSFLMAALRSEGVVRRSTEHVRRWERGDVDGFLSRIRGEQSQPLGAKRPASSPPAASKTPVRPASKPAASRKK